MATNISYLVEQIIALKSLPKGVENFTSYLRKMDSSRGKRISKLFHYLEKHHENFEEDDACYFVFGNHDTKKPAWRKLRNDLGAVLGKYILTEKMYQDEALRLKTKLELARDLHLKDIFTKATKNAEKLDIKNEGKNFEFKETTAYFKFFNNKEGFYPEDDVFLNNCIENLDKGYVTKRLVFSIERLIRSFIGNVPLISAELRLIKNIRKIADLPYISSIPLVQLLVASIDFYLNPNKSSYEYFKTIFFEKIESVYSLKDKLYRFLVNSLAFSNFGENINHEYFYLYSMGDKFGFLSENNQINIETFNNITNICHVLGETRFLTRFVKDYGSLIHDKKKRENSVKLARSYINFDNRNFDNFLEEIKKIEKISPSFTLRIQVLEFKFIYEVERIKYNAFLEIEIIKRRFWRLLNRHKKNRVISKEVHEKHLNFLDMLRKISNTKEHKEDVKENLFRHLLELQGKIAEYHWLARKINDLK